MPAIVRWPGKVKPGSITSELAATYDIFTTVRQHPSCAFEFLAQLAFSLRNFHGFKVELSRVL